MPVTLSAAPYNSVGFSGLPASPRRLPQANAPINPIRFGMDGAGGQDHIELSQQRMEEGTFSEIPLTPRNSGTGQQNRRHGLDIRDIRRDAPPQINAAANAQTPEQAADPEPTVTVIPSRRLIAANGVLAAAFAGLSPFFISESLEMLSNKNKYSEPEGLVKTAGVIMGVFGIGAVGASIWCVKQVFSLISERQRASQEMEHQ